MNKSPTLYQEPESAKSVTKAELLERAFETLAGSISELHSLVSRVTAEPSPENKVLAKTHNSLEAVLTGMPEDLRHQAQRIDELVDRLTKALF